MMQPQGLGALMPQGAQQAPQMNNPRLNAAMDVVTSDAEKQILDPRTLAMLKYKDALQAMQAADQMMAAAQPQPMPPTVAERTKLAAEQGIAGLASRLSPGIQRQGGNMQAQQMQQAMSGGLPQLSAPNMARMAGGGIVAFDNGGGVEGTPTREQLDMMVAAQRARLAEERAQREFIAARNRAAAAGEPIPQSLSEIKPFVGPTDLAAALNQITQQVPTAAPTSETPEDIVAQLPPVERNVSETMAAPVTETYQDASPEAAALRAAALQTANLPSSAPGTTQSAQPSMATEGLRSVLEKIQGQTFDPEAAAEARSAELRRLTGADDLIAQRREEQQRLRQMQEARFSPEESRRRRLRAGLGSLARRGLGGFSAGITEEEGRIFGEQEAVQRQALQDTNALIAELRAMGLTEFEARNAARTAVQGQADTQTQRQADILESLQRGEESTASLDFEREKLATQQASERLSNEQALNIALAEMNQEERQFITETDARTQVALAEAMKDAIEANADTTEVARIYSSALANAPMGVDPVTYARKAVDDFIETYRPTITSGPLVQVNE
jgi:hypothetical protein